MALLELRDLAVEFHTTRQIVRAVRGVSFDVAVGERVSASSGSPDPGRRRQPLP